MIEYCIGNDLKDSFHEGLARAYSSHFSSDRFLGTGAPPFLPSKVGKYRFSQVVKEIDVGRFAHFLFFVDGLQGYENGSFIGMSDIEELSAYVKSSVEFTHQTYAAKDGFREGITVVIGCTWGRNVGLAIARQPENWRTTFIPAYDVTTLSNMPSFQTLDIIRALDAEDELRKLGIEIFNPNGFLNLFGWIRKNDGHIFPHERFSAFKGQDLPRFQIPTNCQLRLRHDAYLAADVKTIVRPDGTQAKLRRIHGSPRYETDQLAPFYADVDALENQVYRGIYLGQRSQYWCQTTSSTELDYTTRYRLSEMTAHWSELVFEFFDTLDDRPIEKAVTCSFTFQDARYPTYEDPVPAEADIGNIVRRVAVDKTSGWTAQFEVLPGFISASRRPDNLAERAIVRALITACLEASRITNDAEKIKEYENKIVRDDTARHFHAFSNPKLHDFVREDLPPAQLIARLDDANIRLGLGWLVRDRAEGSEIDGLEQCQAYLRKLVDALVTSMKVEVSRFDSRALLERLLRNHEALFAEIDTWKRTFGAVSTLSKDRELAVGSAIDKLSRVNAASMSCRIAAKAALCSTSSSQQQPGEYDIARLMTLGSLIHHMGGYSEAMAAEIMPPTIRLSAAGEVMMNHELTDEVIQPFGKFFQSSSLRQAAERYGDNYVSDNVDLEETTERLKSRTAADFEAIWAAEFGYSIDELREFLSGIDAILTSDRKAVMRFRLSELVSRVERETAMSGERVRACIATFTSRPRDEWDQVPRGYLPSAWFPWQFRRSLSIVSRPILQLDMDNDPECLLVPAMTFMNIVKYVEDLRVGAFDQRNFSKDGPMFKWIGRINGETGEAFNEKVATAFQEAGWQAKANLSDGLILDRQKDPGFGDVDVLAADAASGRVLVVECKDLSFDKTIGEIARRLSNYRGSTKRNGKRDDLKKHLDRCLELERNADSLSKHVGFSVKTIERVLLFSQPTPLQFAKITELHSVIVETFENIPTTFAISADPVE